MASSITTFRIFSLLLCCYPFFLPFSYAQFGGTLGRWIDEDPKFWGPMYRDASVFENGDMIEDGIMSDMGFKMRGKPFPVCGFKQRSKGKFNKPLGDLSKAECTYWTDKECNMFKKESGQRDQCYEAQAACQHSLCNPLCLKATWKVKSWIKDGADCDGWIRCDAFKEQIKSYRVQNAIEGQIKAHGCTQVMNCCPMSSGNANYRNRADWAYKWAEQRVYGGMFPAPAIPIPACMHDPENDESGSEPGKREWRDGCKKCISMVKRVELEENVDSNVREGRTENQGCIYGNPNAQLPNSQISKKSESAQFEAVELYRYEDDYPKHPSFQDRCKQVQDHFIKKKNKIRKFWGPQQICGCLGCCDRQHCPYPVTFNDDNFALDEKDHEGDAMHEDVGFEPGPYNKNVSVDKGSKWNRQWHLHHVDSNEPTP